MVMLFQIGLSILWCHTFHTIHCSKVNKRYSLLPTIKKAPPKQLYVANRKPEHGPKTLARTWSKETEGQQDLLQI